MPAAFNTLDVSFQLMHLAAFLPSLQHLGMAGYWFLLIISLGEAFVLTGWVVPGSVVMLLAGGLASQGIYDFWDLVFFASVGAILGDGISYELGHRGKRFVARRPWLQKQVERGKGFFLRHQHTGVFLGRFIGWIRPIIPFVAGIMGMKRLNFYVLNILSGIAWSISYLGVGYVFGTAWNVALSGLGRIALIVLLPILLLFLLLFLWRWMIKNGEVMLRVILSVLRSLWTALRDNEYVRAWTGKHPATVTFLHARISLRHFRGLPLTLLLLATIYSFSIFSGIVTDYLTNDTLVAIDIRLGNLFFAFRYTTLLQAFYAITILANPVSIAATVAALSLVLWFQHKRISLLVLWITLLSAESMTTIGKLLFHRPRPGGLLPVLPEDSYSFPSGHATGAMVLFGFLAYLFLRNHPSWKMKVSVIFSAALLIFLIDLSRLYLGVHYLSDVLAGNTLALTVLLFAISVGESVRSHHPETHASHSLRLPLLTVLFVELACIAGFLLFQPLSQRTLAQPVPPIEIAADDVLTLFSDGTLPRTTESITGQPQEPINLLLLVPDDCLSPALRKASWLQAEVPSLRTIGKTLLAALRNTSYPTAPMTPSFFDTQPHTAGYEKETGQQSARSRHHARFWQTVYATEQGRLFVGTVSLDTGIKWGFTHAIAPDIDTERDLLTADLTQAGIVTQSTLLPLVPPTLGKNFTGDEFFTDGQAVLLTLRCPLQE